MSKIDSYQIAKKIIYNIKNNFLNDDSLLSRTYPTSKSLIFDNFDDLVPFLLYFDQGEFLVNQIKKIKDRGIESLISDNNLIYSYKIDEFIGGLYQIMIYSKDDMVKNKLSQSISFIEKNFVKDNLIYGVYDWKTDECFDEIYPWSAGLIETYLEMNKEYPELVKLCEVSLDSMLDSSYFQKNNLFPYSYSNKERIFVSIRDKMPINHDRCKHQPTYKDSFSVKQKISYLIKKVYFRYFKNFNYAKLMKANTTPLFALIKIYQVTEKEKYKLEAKKWIAAAKKDFIKNGFVKDFCSPSSELNDYTLMSGFVMIDAMADYYFFIEKDESLIDIVKNIADAYLKKQMKNKLIPWKFNSDVSHIDMSLDFSISLRRVREMTNDKYYLEKSKEILHSIFINHKYDIGFCTYLSESTGVLNKGKVNCIDPKYNGLLLKGVISNITMDEKIYENEKLHDLFKDR